MEEKDWRRLQSKITEAGFTGRAKLTRYMEKIARETIIFVQGNVKITFEAK